LLIDNWTLHGATLETAQLTIEESRTVAIRVEHFELGVGAALSFDLWPLPPDRELIGKEPYQSAKDSGQSQKEDGG
jgi:hypothetical protein